MLEYIKDKFPEYLLCLIFAVSVSINVFQGFLVPDSQTSNILGLSLLAATVLIFLYFSFYNKMAVIFSLLILAVCLIIFIVFTYNSNIFSSQFDINLYLFYIITVITTILVFFCSKSRASIIFLFLVNLAVFFILTILEYKSYPFGFIASLVCLCIMFSRKIYIHNTLKYRSRKTNVLTYTGILLILCSISMLFSTGIYYSIILPKNLPEKKLAILAYPTVVNVAERFGIASAQNIPDTTETTTESKEFVNTVIKSKNKNNSSTTKLKNKQAADAANKAQSKPQQASGNNKKTTATPVTYFLELPVLLIVLIVSIIVIILTLITKRLLRRRWYRRLMTLDKNQQVIKLYAYFLRILSILGYTRRHNDTPAEFAKRLGKSVDTGEFSRITDIFIEVNYGKIQIANDNYDFIMNFYKDLLKRCRENLGLFKYVLKYLLI